MSAEERELRVLLERAVPRLPSPAGRMEAVHGRVVRRRRRRYAALGSAAATAALLLTGALLRPGPAGGSQEIAPVAVSPAPRTGETTVTYKELSGLVLRLPAGWQGRQAERVVRLSPQPPPVRGLDPDGALLELRLSGAPSLEASAARSGAVRLTPTDLVPSCRAAGGQKAYAALLDAPDTTGAGMVLVVSLCLGPDAGSRLDQAGRILASASFDTVPKRKGTPST